jgi:hypothetical protein
MQARIVLYTCILIITWCGLIVRVCTRMHAWSMSATYLLPLFAGTAQSVILLRSHLDCAWAGIFPTICSLHYLQTCFQTAPPWAYCELWCAAWCWYWINGFDNNIVKTNITYTQNVYKVCICWSVNALVSIHTARSLYLITHKYLNYGHAYMCYACMVPGSRIHAS